MMPKSEIRRPKPGIARNKVRLDRIMEHRIIRKAPIVMILSSMILSCLGIEAVLRNILEGRTE